MAVHPILIHITANPCAYADTCVPSFHTQKQLDASTVWFSPHRPAGQRVAACLTAHCACLRHLPWLLDVGGGEALQEGKVDPSRNPGKAVRKRKKGNCQ